ncbi:MAG: hypothetical protein J2O48_03085 [Solirubrobacterales bacterium]|nr:hypothetical protein [Solirubrobacterales bacterium]
MLQTTGRDATAAPPHPSNEPEPTEPGRRPEPEIRDPGDMGPLGSALLQRSLIGLSDEIQRCGRCARTLLIGERVHEYASGQIRCELCAGGERASAEHTRTVHGPEFGHTIRVIDKRERS